MDTLPPRVSAEGDVCPLQGLAKQDMHEKLSCRIPGNFRDLPGNYQNWLIRTQMFVTVAQNAKIIVDHWLPNVTGGYCDPFHLGTKVLPSCVHSSDD